MSLRFGNDRAAAPHQRQDGFASGGASGDRAGQNDASDEAGGGVLERELAAVQVTDSRHDGQTEAVAGKAAAPIQTVEARDDLGFLLGRDAGPLVLNYDRDSLPVFSRSNTHD